MNKIIKKRGKIDLILKNKSKKGQITVFVILAICIVIVLFLLFTKKTDFTTIFQKESPFLELEKCLQSSSKEAIEIINLQGGSLNPKNFFMFNGTNISYLCYTNQYYVPCVMQKPMLKEEIETELKNYIEKNSFECFNNVKQTYESKGYSVNMGNLIVKAELIPNNVKVIANINMQMTKENVQSFPNVKTDVPSNLYDFVIIASSIANWETRYGDSETMNYMYFHPDLKVEKKPQSDGTKIYILTNRNSLDKFMFATRSYVRPAGITGK